MMKRKRKGWIIVALAAVLLATAAAAFIIVRYFNYNGYRRYLISYQVEKGSEFKPLTEASADVPGMALAAENDALKLYTDLETTQVAIYEKASGNIIYSNPVDREEDGVATGVNKSLLSATLELIYYSGENRSSMNNYDMSIQYGQFEALALRDGIRYVYTLEDPSNSTGIVPTQISEERLQTLILDKLSKKEAKSLKGKYILKDGIYYLSDGAIKSLINMQRMNDTFEECGYTEEDYAFDMEGAEGAERLSVQITMDYRLTEDGLAVSVPVNQIRESGSVKITRVRVLPYFGAANAQAKGYMMVPDGSGALIYLNKSAGTAPAYMQYVYGMDPVSQSYLVTDQTDTARLPVFGMKNGEQAFLGRITEGDALGIINADVAGRTNSYNYVYAEFCVREAEVQSMFGLTGNSAKVTNVERELYDENLTVVYSFLSGGEADYSGMANCYRAQLVKEGMLGHTEEGDIPFYIDILGGVEIRKAVLGVPYDGIVSMTTYGQAKELLDQIYQAGIGEVRMTYQGWFNGGIYHDAADKVDLIDALGSKSELEDLSRELEEGGGKLFLDVAFQKVSGTSDRFNNLLEASKYYSGYVVTQGAVHPGLMRQTSTLNWYDELRYYIVSPKYLSWYVEHFADRIEKYDVGGISLRDLGDVISSDKKHSEVIHRQLAERVVSAQFETLEETGKELMVSGGNAYTLSHVTDVVDAPTGYSRFFIIDEQIPFYQMVVHGSVDYTGEPLNLMNRDVDDELVLSWIEYGIAPRYTFSWEDSGQIKYTSSADRYSVNHSTWMDNALQVYSRVNEALSPVQGAAMIHHRVLENGLAVVEYDNGVTIYVNRTESPQTAEDGICVEAMSYVRTGGA